MDQDRTLSLPGSDVLCRLWCKPTEVVSRDSGPVKRIRKAMQLVSSFSLLEWPGP